MKHIKHFLLIMAMFMPMIASADVVQIDGIWYDILKKAKKATVVRGEGGYSGIVVIPSTITYDGTVCNVVAIGDCAFEWCESVTSVTIPNSVTSIGERAFYACHNMTSVNIPDGVTSIGGGAFQYCRSLRSVTIPGSVSSISGWAFNECSSLTSVTILDGVTTIGEHAFRDCGNLTSVTLPNSVTSIEGWVFCGCGSLSSITLPSSVTFIGERAFLGCASLPSVTIPNSITRIEGWTFESCSGLTSVTIPNSVTSIGESAFNSCSSLTSVTIPNSVTYLDRWAFAACSGLTSVTIPNNVSTLRDHAFEGCSHLESITIGTGVSHIEERTFADCAELTDVYCMSTSLPCESNAFEGSFIEYATLHVLKSSIDTYKSAGPWKDFGKDDPDKPGIVKIDFPKHYLTYIVDGEEYKKYEIEEFEPIAPEAEPTKEHYAFSGWSTIPSVMPTENVVVTGTFSNIYKLVYKVDGVDYKTFDIEYDTAITPEEAPTKEGYTFSGWSEIPETMPDEDVTVTGSFSANKYKLIYKVNDLEYKSLNVEYGSAITPEEELTKEGYTFSGWSVIPETMPAKDVIVVGTLSVNKYKLIYRIDDSEYKSYDVEYGTPITPEEPTKEGYSFSGWYERYSWDHEIPETMPAHDVTLKGNFSVISYRIEYLWPNGGIINSYYVDYGSPIPRESSPEMEGYTFTGWNEEIPETMPAKDLTLTATFTINTYKLIYMIDDSEYKSYDVEYGASITPEPDPTKEGFTFRGWDQQWWFDDEETMPARDVTINGHFEVNSYSIAYLWPDGGIIEWHNVEFGRPIPQPSSPSMEGYTFAGWDEEIPETMPAKELRITAAFTVNKYKLIYKVDGADYKSFDVEYGASITLEQAPTKEGHSFSEWKPSSDNYWYPPETMPAEDLTLNAIYHVNNYQIFFYLDGSLLGSRYYAYGSAITSVLEPYNKEGYTFSGWIGIPEKMPAEAITVNGTYEKNKYKLVYKVDDAEYKSYDVDYFSYIIPEPEPTKEGYTFSGWSYVPTWMPAWDVTVNGIFTMRQVTVGLTKPKASIETGKTLTLKATLDPSDLSSSSLTWKSSNTAVATVTSVGKVKGVNAGTATITCTYKPTGAKATCKVTIGSVVLDKEEAVIEKDKTVTLKATVNPSADQTVTWTSSDKTIATVSTAGKVTGVKAGTATITATSKATGLTATCTVTVGYVKLDKTEASVEKDKAVTLKATVYPSSLTDKTVTWTSSDKTIATVSTAGKVTGVKAGTATITATSNSTGLKTTCKVTVSYVKLDQTDTALEKGKTMTLTATVYPSSLSDRSVTWKSSNTAIATVSTAGKVKGVKAGTATITATSKATGLKTTCTVTVGYVKLDQTEASVEKGKTVTLKATVYPSSLSDKTVTWKSSNTAIATVSTAGKVKGVKAGTATITCTSKATGLKTTCTVTVGYVKLDKTETTLLKDKTVTLTATVYPSSLSDKSVTWKSSNTAVATVSTAGKVKGVKAGTATITCTSKATGLKATCTVTVENGKVTLNKTEVRVQKGKTVTLKATVTPTSLKDKSVTWKSSNTKIATVTADGKVKGIKAGTATITCTSNATGKKATCTVTVLQSMVSLPFNDDEMMEEEMDNLGAEEPFDVYDLNGRMVKSQVTSLDGLPRGIYIINGKKVMKK